MIRDQPGHRGPEGAWRQPGPGVAAAGACNGRAGSRLPADRIGRVENPAHAFRPAGKSRPGRL